jgi:phosphoglycolate phosphatase-like HAD superfamily hydrolase
MKFDHYLFDLDGTIVSTKEIHQKSFNQALVELGFAPVDDKSLYLYEAMPSFDKIEKYNALNNQDVDIKKFLLIKDKYSEINIENCHNLFDQDLNFGIESFDLNRKRKKWN